MATASPSSLVDALRQYRLLEPVQLEELKNLQARFPDPKALAKELIQRGWLTPYQANQLLLGRGNELLLGSYILLERLGEGGMGEVFKARNWKLAKVVALKLIRKERLDNPTAIKRFQREVRSAAALDHPNIVRALDADEIGGTHLLVMEYIEGATDLSRLVKKNGPLPVPEACEFIRQAALGLQHAYERGLVHRDIKPHNLLMTADGKTVKILDMGLARLDQPCEDDKSSTMTQDGAVMGTPDYIAPEQALESHTVDVRADLYSLGCTFYYLLTGRVPFPGGTLLQKLNKHQNEEARPVELLRFEVPPGVTEVVYKLMAKKPGDRYQTPAEVVAALEAVSSRGSGGSLAASGSDRTLADGRRSAAAPRGDSINSVFAFTATGDNTEDLVGTPPHLGRKAGKRRCLPLSVAGGAFLLVGLVVILILGLNKTGGKKPKDEDHPVVVAPSKKAPGTIDEAWLKQVAEMSAEQQVDAVTAKLKELNPSFDGKMTHNLDGDVVTELSFVTDNVTDISPVRALKELKALSCHGSEGGKGRLSDLSPLKDMKLTWLNCGNTKVTDLSPVKGMPLTTLLCGGTQVSDLSPLKGMGLTFLHCEAAQVSDLSPLKGMQLTILACHFTPVSDLSPLKDMKLTSLFCSGTKVSDLSPLKDMPLKYLYWDFKPYRDTKILRSIKTLEAINEKPVKEFWKEVEVKQAAFEAWRKEVAAMPAEKQVDAVAAKLKELNPAFGGKVTREIAGGVVTGFHTDNNVTDISPVRALNELKGLSFAGPWGKGRLSDLSPLKDMKLTYLDCGGTQVADLSPLKGMPLTSLYCGGTQVADLSPLSDMKLTYLYCAGTQVADLSPLKGMPLTGLVCHATQVADLSPLKGMPLTSLHFPGTKVADLSPLKDMKLTLLNCAFTKVTDLLPLKGIPLKEVSCDFRPFRDAEILRSIKTLEKINEKPVKGFWKEVEAQQAAFEAWCKQVAAMPAQQQVDAVAAKLKELNPGFDGKVTHKVEGDVVTELAFVTDNVTDILPVRALKGLKSLACGAGSYRAGKLSDLSPLRGMSLTSLECNGTPVADLSPLKGMPLKSLYCPNTQIADLSPLKGMPVTKLNCSNEGRDLVSDLSPLKDMPIKELHCDFKAERDAEILCSIQTLERINGKEAKEFWKEVKVPVR